MGLREVVICPDAPPGAGMPSDYLDVYRGIPT